MIKIVTDTISDLPKEIISEYDITVIPVYVTFGEQTFRDQIDLSSKEFYAKLVSSRVMPTTNEPSVDDFERIYSREAALNAGATILSIHVSEALSGTIVSAKAAAARLPNLDIRVFDTRSLSLGQGLLVRQAAVMAREGLRARVILERLAQMRDNLNIYYGLETLEFLARGGRIGRGTQLMGNLLDMKPILTLRNGAVEPFKKPRNRDRLLKTLQDLVVVAGMGAPGFQLGVMHANCSEEARHLERQIMKKIQPAVTLFSHISPSIGTHTGPGTIGVCWYTPGNRG